MRHQWFSRRLRPIWEQLIMISPKQREIRKCEGQKRRRAGRKVKGNKWCHFSSLQSERGSSSRSSQKPGTTEESLHANIAVKSQTVTFLYHYFFEIRLRKKMMEEAGLKNSALWSFYPTLGSNNINHMLKINKDVNQSRQRNPQPLNKYHKLSIIIVYHVEIFPQRWKLWGLWSTAAPGGQEAVSLLQCRLSTLWGLGTE